MPLRLMSFGFITASKLSGTLGTKKVAGSYSIGSGLPTLRLAAPMSEYTYSNSYMTSSPGRPTLLFIMSTLLPSTGETPSESPMAPPADQSLLWFPLAQPLLCFLVHVLQPHQCRFREVPGS